MKPGDAEAISSGGRKMERAGRGIRWPEGHSKRSSKCVATSGDGARDKEHVQRTALPECEEFIGQEAGIELAGIFIIPQQRPEQQHAHVQHDFPPKAQMRTTPGRITRLNTASNVQACLCRPTQLDYHMRHPGAQSPWPHDVAPPSRRRWVARTTVFVVRGLSPCRAPEKMDLTGHRIMVII
jgi:hypothetical protein